ncbi:MAG: hypothetical protein WA419_12415 [Silvibacterium sp.]
MPDAPIRFKFGKHPPRHDPRTLQLKNYLGADLPAPPATEKNWMVKIPDKRWGMMGNDNYGDCTCAAAGHMIMEWTAHTQPKPVVVPDAAILQFYENFSGAGLDSGANLLDVLKYWRKTGLEEHQILAFVAIALKNPDQLKTAVSIFANCYIGIALPHFAAYPPAGKDITEIPWVVPAGGPVGKAAPNPNEGHCVAAVGYDEQNVYVVTWGQIKPMSWEFYTAYADEAFAVLSKDWLARNKAPNGFALAVLEKDLSHIKAHPRT